MEFNNYIKMDDRFCKYPRWKPELWNENIPEEVKDHTNCYSYALNRIELNLDDKLQPGEISGEKYDFMDCDVIFQHIKNDLNREDIFKTDINKKPNCLQNKIALALDIKSEDKDYHFYRLDNNGTWSHKPGSTNATNKDARDDLIFDPEKADRDYSFKEYINEEGETEYGKNYALFCGFYMIPQNRAPMIYDWNAHYEGDNSEYILEDHTNNINELIED